MAFIFVDVHGNGVAYVDNPNPVAGDPVTLYATPDPNEQLLDIIARDQGGHYIALDPGLTVQTFTYNSDWGNVVIEVYFSGSIPPQPTLSASTIALLFKKSMDKRQNKGRIYRR